MVACCTQTIRQARNDRPGRRVVIDYERLSGQRQAIGIEGLRQELPVTDEEQVPARAHKGGGAVGVEQPSTCSITELAYVHAARVGRTVHEE